MVLAVWSENRDPLHLFLLCATQWRHAGMDGMPTGLDYAGVEAAARMAAIPLTPTLFRDLQTMEAAALSAWEEERNS
ncbi:MAG: DUF1799 domain-containing protein [Magnetococcus sp. MYC-9]